MTTLGTDFHTRLEDLRQRYVQSERPASTARGVHHVALICRDVEETIGFYQDLLGFPLVAVFENRDYKGSAHLFFDVGNENLLAFFDFPGLGLGLAVETIGSLQHLALSVDSERFEEVKALLDERGIGYLGPDRGVENSIYFRDPNGIQIELLKDRLFEINGRRPTPG
jgi:glyoxylase I family protein